MTIVSGATLGHYKIISQLGAGGMGEVYLAQDTKLDRKVALKVLPADVASHRNRMERFVLEAKSAAALNHPYIAQVFEIGEHDGTHFIAMEFIDGVTLGEMIHRDKAALGQLLKYLIQVAEGLTKAHAAGIVHRDLKPDNIMITRDGFAKILDFGLAKLIEAQRSPGYGGDRSSEIVTAVMPQASIPGMVIGTVGYMSPEQAQGRVKEVDHRSDIFSFGCLIFEAVTRKRAFEGKDVLDSLHKIVNAPTPQIKDINPVAPNELQHIVRRCLAKEPDKRYQSIKEVSIELEELQQELKGVDYLVQSSTSVGTELNESPQVEPVSTRSISARTTATVTALSTSSAEYLVGEIKRHKLGALLAIVAFAVVVAGAIFGAYKWLGAAGSGETPHALKITRLTTSGTAPRAAISPDGKYVVYVQMGEGRRQSLRVRQVSTSSDIQILPEDGAAYRGITFSPDGDFIFYVRNEPGSDTASLWRSPVLGGNARKIIDNVNSYAAVSPDGKQVAFVRTDQGQAAESLMVANIDGSGERKLTARKTPNQFAGSSPAWSPDGKIIAIGQEDVTGGNFRSVIGVRIEDGTEQPFTDRKWSGNYTPDLAWLSDNSGVLVTASEQAGSNPQIWFLAWPGNEVRQVTSDLSSFANITVTSDSNTVCAVRSESITNLWVADNTDLDNARPITSGAERYDGYSGINWTPDGRIVFSSQAGGEQNIWMVGTDGGGNRQISSTARRNRMPVVSPDGRYIVWQSNRGSGLTIWRMDIDGGSLKQLTEGGSDYEPQISPDGKWVIFTRVSPGQLQYSLWKVSIDGGAAVPIEGGSSSSGSPVISPEGTKIAYIDAGSRGRYSKIVVIPFEGGPAIASVEFPEREDNPGGGALGIIQWTVDGRAIAFVRDVKGRSNIWTLPLDGGAPKQLTHYKDLGIRTFAWSRDGKQLALSRGSSTRDVVLIKNFR